MQELYTFYHEGPLQIFFQNNRTVARANYNQPKSPSALLGLVKHQHLGYPEQSFLVK